jgi:hypothetical protein
MSARDDHRSRSRAIWHQVMLIRLRKATSCLARPASVALLPRLLVRDRTDCCGDGAPRLRSSTHALRRAQLARIALPYIVTLSPQRLCP